MLSVGGVSNSTRLYDHHQPSEASEANKSFVVIHPKRHNGRKGKEKKDTSSAAKGGGELKSGGGGGNPSAGSLTCVSEALWMEFFDLISFCDPLCGGEKDML